MVLMELIKRPTSTSTTSSSGSGRQLVNRTFLIQAHSNRDSISVMLEMMMLEMMMMMIMLEMMMHWIIQTKLIRTRRTTLNINRCSSRRM